MVHEDVHDDLSSARGLSPTSVQIADKKVLSAVSRKTRMLQPGFPALRDLHPGILKLPMPEAEKPRTCLQPFEVTFTDQPPARQLPGMLLP